MKISTGNKSRLHSCVSEMVGETADECVYNAVVSVFVSEFYTDVHECEYHHFYEGTVHKNDDSAIIYSPFMSFHNNTDISFNESSL